MAFTCSFCKFRTFEEKEIESHLESAAHQETLDHIQKQTKFDKVVMEFLHVRQLVLICIILLHENIVKTYRLFSKYV